MALVYDLVHGVLSPGPEDDSDGDLAGLRDAAVVVTCVDGSQHRLNSNVLDGSLRFDIHEFQRPVTRFEVRNEVLGVEILSLENLFYSSDQEFEKSFTSKRDRPNFPRLDYFIGLQTFKYFRGSVGYRVSASVVCAYKAIELGDDRYLADAETMLLQALIVLPSGDLARTPRNNREHLQVSVLTALWHLYLARGELDDFVRTLLALRDLLAQKSFESYFILSFNMGKSLRLLTLLYKFSGMEEAAASNSKLARQLFQLSAQGATGVIAHFSELGVFHHDVYESMRLARREGRISGALIDKTLKESMRISAEEHPEAFEGLKSNFVIAARTMRAFLK